MTSELATFVLVGWLVRPMASFLEDRRQLLLFGWMGMSETASGCKYLDRSRNRLLSRLVPLRHNSVPVGEMLFAIGFTSEAREGLESRAISYAAGPEW